MFLGIEPAPSRIASLRARRSKAESDMSHLDRITVDPRVMGGRPCIRGMRFPVSRILGLLAAGEDQPTILRNHPDLEPEDIQQALEYAVLLADNQVVALRTE